MNSDWLKLFKLSRAPPCKSFGLKPVISCASTIVRNVAVSNEDSNLSTIWDKFLKVFYQVAHQGFSIPGCIGREFEIEQALKIYR